MENFSSNLLGDARKICMSGWMLYGGSETNMKVIFCPYLSELKECPCEYEKECIKRREVLDLKRR